MILHTRRAYLPARKDDGVRLLVDRLWPRGLARQALAADAWLKDVAPSTALRTWFGHDPARWKTFRRRYFAELDAAPDAVAELRAHLAPSGPTTLLFGARDEAHNNAVALRDYLLGRAP